MELLQLSYFRVVANLEHMSRAATELGIAQASLSKAIKRLEQELGVPLFDRQGRGIRLNQFGTIFLRHVEDILDDLTAATDEVRDRAGLHQGVVSVAAGALHWLPPLLQPFLTAHPAVQFRLSQHSLADMHQLLASGEIDLCFIPADPATPTVRWRPLGSEEIFLVVPPTHRLAGRSTVPLREVAAEGMILGKPGGVLREVMDDAFRTAGIRPQIVCEADEPGAVEAFVAAGVGVAFLPGLADRLSGPGRVKRLRISAPRCRLVTGLAWNERRFLSQAAHSFRAHAIARFDALVTAAHAAGDGQSWKDARGPGSVRANDEPHPAADDPD